MLNGIEYGLTFDRWKRQDTYVEVWVEKDALAAVVERAASRLYKYSWFEEVEVRRLALNMDQVDEYGPPPNYAKASSSRFDGYVSEYGETCWELDALEPRVIDGLITDAVNEYIDQDAWDECETQEEEGRQYLSQVYDRWDEIKAWLDEN